MKKYRVFILKVLNLCLIAVILYFCQQLLLERSEQDAAAYAAAQEEQARLDAEYEEYMASIGMASEEEEESGFRDGIYEGTANGYGGPITVSVTISGGKIDAIDVVSHAQEDPAYYSMAEAITSKIISSQTPDVDTIAGASYSSNGIKNAVIKALQQAL